MRGTLARYRDIGNDRRFIPAYAGNASIHACLGVGFSVHPRVCGERLVASKN